MSISQRLRVLLVIGISIFAVTGCGGGGGSGSGDSTTPPINDPIPPVDLPDDDDPSVTPPVDEQPPVDEVPPTDPGQPPVGPQDPVVEPPQAAPTVYQKLKSWDQMLVSNDQSLEPLEKFFKEHNVRIAENTATTLRLDFYSASVIKTVEFQQPTGGAGIEANAWLSAVPLQISESSALPIEAYKLSGKLLLVIAVEERPITIEISL